MKITGLILLGIFYAILTPKFLKLRKQLAIMMQLILPGAFRRVTAYPRAKYAWKETNSNKNAPLFPKRAAHYRPDLFSFLRLPHLIKQMRALTGRAVNNKLASDALHRFGVHQLA